MKGITIHTRVCCDLDHCVFDFDATFLPFCKREGYGDVPKNYGVEGFDRFITKRGHAEALFDYYQKEEHKKENLIPGARPTLLALAREGAAVWYVSSRMVNAGLWTVRKMVELGLPCSGVVCAGTKKLNVILALSPSLIIDDDHSLLLQAKRSISPTPDVVLIPAQSNEGKREKVDRCGWKGLKGFVEMRGKRKRKRRKKK